MKLIKNYAKVLFQFFLNNKLSYLISILGLSIGIAVFLLLVQFVAFEKNYDSFHENHKRIVRLRCKTFSNDVLEGTTKKVGFSVAPLLAEKLPEIENYVRLNWLGNSVISYENNIFFDLFLV